MYTKGRALLIIPHGVSYGIEKQTCISLMISEYDEHITGKRSVAT